MSTIARTLFAAAAGAALISAAAPADAQFYKGKTINMVVPVPGGSGLDLNARIVTRFLSKHIPGNPEIVARNMPGAGGVKALNFVYDKGAPDGLTLIYGPWNAAGVIAKLPGIRFVPEKFEFIGAGSTPQTTIMRTGVAPGMKTAADIVKVGVFNIAGRSADRELDLAGNLALDIMGVRYRYVPGFRGMAKINPAIRQNEMQAGHSGYTGYVKFFKDSLIKDGKALALWYHSYFDADGNAMNNPIVKDFASFHDVYKQVHGKLPSGPKWEAYKWLRSNVSPMTRTVFMPPGTKKEAVEIMRTAYAKMTKDPGFLDAITKISGVTPTYVPLDQGLKVIKTYRDISPETLAVFKEMGKKGQENVKK